MVENEINNNHDREKEINANEKIATMLT